MTLAELLAALVPESVAGHGAKEVVYDLGGNGQINCVSVVGDDEFIKSDESIGHLMPQIVLSSDPS
jgi:hypothetical protein